MTDRKIDLAEIAEAAGKAAPGPWFAVDVTEDGLTVVDDGRHSGMHSIKAETYEASHIALNDPGTSLAFVAAVRAARTVITAKENGHTAIEMVASQALRDALQPFVDGEVIK